MHIGLIGGIGPAATDYYYRRLIAAFASRKMPLELTIAHADAPTLLNNLASDDKAGQAAIFTRLAKRLAEAGANCVAITSIAGHFCMDAFKAASPLPAIDMIVEVNRAVSGRGVSRVGILGTRTVMETRFFGGVTSAVIVPPDGQDLLDVHQAYVTMAASGVVTEAQRSVFNAASHRLLKDKGAEAILLGGTDLVLAFDERTSDFPLIDCAGVHADAIARLAIG
jgi:aspartate racemase